MKPSPASTPVLRASAWGAACLIIGAATLPQCGCAIGQLVGGMAASAHRTGSHTVEAKYKGLGGKSFAVIVAAHQSIQADFPDLVPTVTAEITRRIVEAPTVQPSGVVPAVDVLRFQYQRPGWVAMSPEDLAEHLGVERLIFVDLTGYALTDQGNAYLWNGSATGTVNVYEADGLVPGEFSFRENVSVQFPDNEGLSPMQIPARTVELELTRRFVLRASWMFFEHDEPNAIEF